MNQYDYTNQAWIIDGRYDDCGHPESMNCRCFGRAHAGEPAVAGASIHPTEEEYANQGGN